MVSVCPLHYLIVVKLEVLVNSPVSEFNEFKPRLKSPETRFQLSVGLNI